ncbi:MAG: hypothetical protein DLM56_11595 [Pseudonocardiales bacterium]|nr:MAG: hypothetical protein DLM56_11595 [Pseudonocardiales bacterium]
MHDMPVTGAAVSEAVDGDYEYVPMRMPPGTNCRSAALQLTLQAEYSGWELARLRLRTDGTRQLWLRRKRTSARLPGPAI